MYVGNVFGAMQMFALNEVVRTPKVFPMEEKSYLPWQHSSAVIEQLNFDKDHMENRLSASQTYDEFYQSVRQDVVVYMIDVGFSGFVSRPWQQANDVIVFSTWDVSFVMNWSLDSHDALDEVLASELLNYKKYFDEYKKFSSYAEFSAIEIDLERLLSLDDVFLFKDDADLQALRYEVLSYRYRINHDKEYRRYNISTAFANMGNIFILNPSQEYDVMDSLHYNPRVKDGKKEYKWWYAIFGNSERLVYAGGLCGVATAITQWILTNTALEILEKKAHSMRYRDLYTAVVNWEIVDKPGLDATVYSDQINVRFKNISDYPVVLVMNYDGSVDGMEQVFSLWYEEHRGDFSFVDSYARDGYKCYRRDVNGRILNNCYKKIVFN